MCITVTGKVFVGKPLRIKRIMPHEYSANRRISCFRSLPEDLQQKLAAHEFVPEKLGDNAYASSHVSSVAGTSNQAPSEIAPPEHGPCHEPHAGVSSQLLEFCTELLQELHFESDNTGHEKSPLEELFRSGRSAEKGRDWASMSESEDTVDINQKPSEAAISTEPRFRQGRVAAHRP